MTRCSEMAYNLLRFTLLSKNASANHLESHSCKNKGLKVPCFHTLTKNIGGEGVGLGRWDHFAVHSLAPHRKRAAPEAPRNARKRRFGMKRIVMRGWICLVFTLGALAGAGAAKAQDAPSPKGDYVKAHYTKY